MGVFFFCPFRMSFFLIIYTHFERPAATFREEEFSLTSQSRSIILKPHNHERVSFLLYIVHNQAHNQTHNHDRGDYDL